ncbi:MAG: hypothetical protein IIY72_03175 [Solobacterium sp.]|nr:hypothetical protein [Erysipelotrichaceae bacterium]MBQ1324594.1 hypothetical protein [Solobacterium sp.]MBQ1355455.1 hypothetical protein [Solobacterium sp.]MBQ1446465.1 hypothetical protein [Solobacterium sp.]MBQ6593175.1 hypothetical protein [Solobacterium sp.]
MEERYNLENIEVQMALVIKLHELQRDVLPSISYSVLEDYISTVLWPKGAPRTLNQAVDDIMRIDAGEIVKSMAMQAKLQSGRSTLADYSDVIGGKNQYEE